GSFQISGTAHPGDAASGQIRVSYDLFRRSPNDPTFDPTVDTISTGNVLTAAARVAVPGVPEPASLGSVGIALLGLAALKRRSPRSPVNQRW
ncbi:MAG: PEP-CTERM sorting domain-containing protein, partial [Acidobacteriota bacterium]|nr:PEP-CTERM sorting domain-containing protein [Acidobacteriota bacterium]